MSYKETAEEVLKYAGGAENVNNVYHCATRLRFTLNSSEHVDIEKLKSVNGVLNVLGNGTQIQVVIGSAVNKVYNELTPMLAAAPAVDKEADAGNSEGSKEKSWPIDKVFNVIAGIFAPYLPLLMCSGIVTGLLSLASTMGWFDTSSGTYAILSAASNSLFYFFPVLLAYTAAKQFHTNPFVAVMIGAALIHPTFTALAEAEGAVTFFGIPVIMQTYSSTVIPAIAGVGLYSVIDHKLSKILPDSLRSLIITLVGMVIVVPLTIIVFGPVGNYLSTALGKGLNALVTFNPLIAGIIGGGLCGYMAMFGLQWGIIPIILINISNLGYDYFTPMWMMGPYAQVGIALAVFIKAKQPELKQLSLTGFLTGLFTGVTEPILYGLLTKYKKLNIYVVIGGAVGGAVVGATHTQVIAFLFAGVLNFPGYFGPTFIYYIIGLVLAIGIAAVLALIFGYEDKNGLKKGSAAAR